MHLKNFSLIKKNLEYELCPAYDLVASELVVEGDDEYLALHLNGKKKKIKRADFENSMKTSGLDQKVMENIFKKHKKLMTIWSLFMDQNFLPDKMKEDYKYLIQKNKSA